jgi:hypothetical protein
MSFEFNKCRMKEGLIKNIVNNDSRDKGNFDRKVILEAKVENERVSHFIE